MAGPSRDWSVFTPIFADHWEPFQHAHPRSQTAYSAALGATMLACGHPAQMGYVADRCRQGGQGTHRVAMRCQASWCWRCATVHVENWVSQVSTRLHAGGSARHLILTVPALCRTPCSQKAAVVLSALRRCGVPCLDDFESAVRGKALRGAPARCSTRLGAMVRTSPLGICARPVGGLLARERAGSIARTCPTISCVVKGSGTW